MDNIFKRDSADIFMDILLKYVTPNDFIALLQDKRKAKEFYRELGWYENGNYFGDIANDILSDFTIKYSDILLRYIEGVIPLHEVCNILIRYIFKQKYSLDEKKLYSCLVNYADAVDIGVENVLNNLTSKSHINLFGFGLRDGVYEEKIKEILIRKSFAKSIDIYGYDPDCSEASSNVVMLSPDQINSNFREKFDCILIKWVLHHVDHSERWEKLLKFINHTNQDAAIIIIEEGCFPTYHRESLAVVLYEMIAAFADVIINTGLHPKWLDNIVNGIDAPFFINYLSYGDMKTIEQEMKFNFNRTIAKIGTSFFTESIITYKVSNPTKTIRPSNKDISLIRGYENTTT